jgi:hypothetical protein
MESKDFSSLNNDDVLSTSIENIMLSMKLAEKQMRQNSLADARRFACIDFDAILGPKYTMDTINKWVEANEENSAIIMSGLYRKAAELSVELRSLQVSNAQLDDGNSLGIIDHFIIPKHSFSQGIELCYQSKFSGCAFCSLLEFFISMEKSVLSSLTLNNIGLRTILDSYGNNIVDVSDMEDQLHNKIYVSVMEDQLHNKISTKEEKHYYNSQTSLEGYTVQLLEKCYESPYLPSMMTIEYTSKCQESIDKIDTGYLNSSSEECVVLKLSFSESSLKISSLTEILRFENYT